MAQNHWLAILIWDLAGTKLTFCAPESRSQVQGWLES